jgi:hypothetical protein
LTYILNPQEIQRHRRPRHPQEKQLKSERAFCSNCSSPLWVFDKSWPELIHPFASVIDTPLPVPEEMVCVKANSKPEWVRWPEGKKSVHQDFGEDSLEGGIRREGCMWSREGGAEGGAKVEEI